MKDEKSEWYRAIEIAALHVELQHAVWDNTNIPPRALLDLLATNIRALKDYRDWEEK